MMVRKLAYPLGLLGFAGIIVLMLAIPQVVIILTFLALIGQGLIVLYFLWTIAMSS